MGWTTTAKEYRTLDPDTYQARLISVGEQATSFGKALKFTWIVQVAEDDEEQVSGLATWREEFTAKTKLWQWAEALLGRPIDKGEQLTEDKLVGKRCRLLLGIVEKDGKKYNTVERVLSSKLQAGSPAEELF